MDNYRHYVEAELGVWLFQMKKHPSLMNQLTNSVQNKINAWIPDKVHRTITVAIENVVKGVLKGSGWIVPQMDPSLSLKEREEKVRTRIKWYRNTATAEGAVSGAGGILLGLVDFPAFLSIKMKMLFDIASLYGFPANDFHERIFLLYVFQLSFSSQNRRNELIEIIEKWESYSQTISVDSDQFDWKLFQQQYRDYIDLAKLAQLIPVIGAGVGALANYRLTSHLGLYAMNAYRLRVLN
jgi:hypothetical protein